MNWKETYQKQVSIGWFKTKEVMDILGVSRPTLHRWSKIGYLVPVKVGATNRYLLEDVENVISMDDIC